MERTRGQLSKLFLLFSKSFILQEEVHSEEFCYQSPNVARARRLRRAAPGATLR